MLSKVRIGTHPIHPMLMLIPAGAFLNVLILDIVYMATRSTPWWEATAPLLLIGVIGGIAAAIPGAIDLLTVARAQNAQRPGLIHGLGNVVVVAIFAWNAVLRWTAANPPIEGAYLGFWLSLIGSALLAVTGWMGWKMVQEYHVGVLEHPEAKDPPPEMRHREAAD